MFVHLLGEPFRLALGTAVQVAWIALFLLCGGACAGGAWAAYLFDWRKICTGAILLASLFLWEAGRRACELVRS